MDSDSWQEKQIVVLGLARQGKAVARFLAERGARVIVSDLKGADELAAARSELSDLPLEYELGGHPETLLDKADLLFLSGGVPASLPLVATAHARGIPTSNDSQLFLEACPAETVGLTGSAGKSTTTALLGEMGRAEGVTTWVGGNIGRPLLRDLDGMTQEDLVVIELSSFQLELMTTSPTVAAVLNLTPNHLDRHGTMANYTAAKARILENQTEEDAAVLNHDDPLAWRLRDRVRGRLLSFGQGEPPQGEGAFLRGPDVWLHAGGEEEPVLPVAEIALRGEHNVGNVLAACALAAAVGLSTAAMAAAGRTFAGLPHRLEQVGTVAGVDWYNDSIATTPERAVAGIRSFQRPLVLLAGGRDKGLDWRPLAQEMIGRVRVLVTFGECGGTVASAVRQEADGTDGPHIIEVSELAEAVDRAAGAAEHGDVVLLSPGGTSFDDFADFEERGDRFRELVGAL